MVFCDLHHKCSEGDGASVTGKQGRRNSNPDPCARAGPGNRMVPALPPYMSDVAGIAHALEQATGVESSPTLCRRP